jgi:type I restriction enzyme S subunit
LGEVPSHWEVKPLKHLAAIDSCGSYGVEAEEAEIALPVATTAQIDADGRFAVDRMPVRGFVPAEVQRFGCSDGDILVVKSSGSATNIISGKAGLVDEATPPFVFSNFLMRVRPSRELTSPKFIYALLRSQLTRQRVEQMCSTTTYPNLQVGEYCSAPLPIPPPAEQTLIAEFLDRETGKIDELVAEQRRLMELLKEKRQAVISHAVTHGLNPAAPLKPSGIEWLGDVPAHWEVMTLRRCATYVQTGGTPSSEPPSADLEEGLVWFTPGDFGDSLRLTASTRKISPAMVASGEAKVFPPRSVLVVSIGATLGKVGFAQEASSANQQINAVIPNERIDGYFLAYSLLVKAEVMRFLSNASTIGIMNQEKTKDIWIAVPPPAEQAGIAAFLDAELAKFDTLTAEAQRAIALLQERRTALISAAVTGQIDVRQLAEKKAA